jgi:hypothetical protein
MPDQVYDTATYMANLCPIMIVVSRRVTKTATTILHSEGADCKSIRETRPPTSRARSGPGFRGALR